MIGMFGATGGGSGGGGGKPPNPLIAASGRWLATCIAVYATIFWTPDVWEHLEPSLSRAIAARYDGFGANLVYWLLKIAAYPLMYFGVRMGLALAFMGLAMGVMLKLFAGHRQ